jgi:hypothetical protein
MRKSETVHQMTNFDLVFLYDHVQLECPFMQSIILSHISQLSNIDCRDTTICLIDKPRLIC